MSEGINFKPKPEYSLSKHLNPEVKPIMVCVDTHNDFLKKYGDVDFNSRGKNIDFEEKSKSLKKQSFLNDGDGTYVISTVDESNKFTEELFDCTSLVVTGIDKTTGKNISFLTHQDPKEFFLWTTKDKFKKDIKTRLGEIRDRCVPGTVDAVIVGGDYDSNSSKKNYVASIKLLTEEVNEVFNFEPIIVNGPMGSLEGEKGDRVFYDNKERRLYLIRIRINEDTGSFTNSDIDEEKEKWKDQKDQDGWGSFYNS